MRQHGAAKHGALNVGPGPGLRGPVDRAGGGFVIDLGGDRGYHEAVTTVREQGRAFGWNGWEHI